MTVTIPKPINSSGVKMVLFRSRGYDKLVETELFDPATKGTVTLTVPGTAVFPATSTVILDLKAKCSNKNIIAKLSTSVALYKFDATSATYKYYKSGFVTDGLTTFTLENNQKYKVEVYYSSKTYSTVIDYKSANFSFSTATTNASIVGDAIYNSTTNTYATTADIAITCN